MHGDAMEEIELEQAVEEYLEFIRLPHTELSYEARLQAKNEKLRAMIVALNRRRVRAA